MAGGTFPYHYVETCPVTGAEIINAEFDLVLDFYEDCDGYKGIIVRDVLATDGKKLTPLSSCATTLAKAVEHAVKDQAYSNEDFIAAVTEDWDPLQDEAERKWDERREMEIV